LTTVRGHLTSGTSRLLLFTGEAGIGKTTLVGTAAAGTVASGRVFVATGACLPLSSNVPLLPFAAILRTVYDADHGQWLKEALSDLAPYVSACLPRLLPELDAVVDAPIAPDDEWSRQRLSPRSGRR
jgi:predicted ATPase